MWIKGIESFENDSFCLLPESKYSFPFIASDFSAVQIRKRFEIAQQKAESVFSDEEMCDRLETIPRFKIIHTKENLSLHRRDTHTWCGLKNGFLTTLSVTISDDLR